MSPVEPDARELFDEFISETRDMLGRVDSILRDSRAVRSVSKDSINELFRLMHTVKSAAAMMGFDSVSAVAHGIEDIFSVLRENPDDISHGPLEGERMFDSLLDAVFQSLDSINREIGSIIALSYIDGEPPVADARAFADDARDMAAPAHPVALESVFANMRRVVYDMIAKQDKKARFAAEGGEIEVDKHTGEIISDICLHIIRNSVDHGIEAPPERIARGKPETGLISLSAKIAGWEILIDITDDGRGLDPNALLSIAKRKGLLVKPESAYTDEETFAFIMLPGFSTSPRTTEYSGRGVGMDVVRDRIEKAGGAISISSVRETGTTFTVRIPLQKSNGSLRRVSGS